MPAQAYNEGYDAYYSKQRRNPYRSNTYLRAAWATGYKAAHDGKSREEGMADTRKR